MWIKRTTMYTSSVQPENPVSSDTQQSTESGPTDAQAQFNLGLDYANGHGVPQNYGEVVSDGRRAGKCRGANLIGRTILLG